MENVSIEGLKEIVLFTLDKPAYALPLSYVERVIRAVEVMPLPKAPDIVLGVINEEGKVIPVIDIRKRFRLPTHELNPDDFMIIAKTPKRRMALVVDFVEGIKMLTKKELVVAKEFPFAAYLKGVVKLEQGPVVICDLDRFLSLEEDKTLEEALRSV